MYGDRELCTFHNSYFGGTLDVSISAPSGARAKSFLLVLDSGGTQFGKMDEDSRGSFEGQISIPSPRCGGDLTVLFSLCLVTFVHSLNCNITIQLFTLFE